MFHGPLVNDTCSHIYQIFVIINSDLELLTKLSLCVSRMATFKMEDVSCPAKGSLE